jgi:hypothetical protein
MYQVDVSKIRLHHVNQHPSGRGSHFTDALLSRENTLRVLRILIPYTYIIENLWCVTVEFRVQCTLSPDNVHFCFIECRRHCDSAGYDYSNSLFISAMHSITRLMSTMSSSVTHPVLASTAGTTDTGIRQTYIHGQLQPESGSLTRT